MWNERLDAKLLHLRSEGLSFAEVAELLGVTEPAAAGRAQRLSGVTFPSQQRRKELRQKKRVKRSREKRAKERLLAKALKKALRSGIPRSAAIHEAVKAGASYQLIGGMIGVSRQRVCQILTDRTDRIDYIAQ